KDRIILPESASMRKRASCDAAGAKKRGAQRKRPALSGRPGPGCGNPVSDRVVHLELDRVRGVLEGVDLFPLELDVGLDLVLGEDVAGQQELVIGGQGLQRLAQRAADLRNGLQLLRRQVVEVL